MSKIIAYTAMTILGTIWASVIVLVIAAQWTPEAEARREERAAEAQALRRAAEFDAEATCRGLLRKLVSQVEK